MNAFRQLTSDKHSSAAGCFPCRVFYQTGVGPSILWQWLLHHKAHLSTVKGGFPKESHFTCRWERPKEHETGRTNATCRNNDEKEEWMNYWKNEPLEVWMHFCFCKYCLNYSKLRPNIAQSYPHLTARQLLFAFVAKYDISVVIGNGKKDIMHHAYFKYMDLCMKVCF